MHSKCANCQEANGFFNVPKRGVKRVHQGIGLKRRHVARNYLGNIGLGDRHEMGGTVTYECIENLHASLRWLGGKDRCQHLWFLIRVNQIYECYMLVSKLSRKRLGRKISIWGKRIRKRVAIL